MVIIVANLLISTIGWSRLFEFQGILSVVSLVKAGFFDKDLESFSTSRTDLKINYTKIFKQTYPKAQPVRQSPPSFVYRKQFTGESSKTGDSGLFIVYDDSSQESSKYQAQESDNRNGNTLISLQQIEQRRSYTMPNRGI